MSPSRDLQRERAPGTSTPLSPTIGPGISGVTGPGKRTLVEAVSSASAPPHAASPHRIAERADAPPLNAAIKIVAYDANGRVVRSWSARARWEGVLPQHLHGSVAGAHWVWDDATAAHSVRLHARADGTGGESVERWAAALGAARVEIYAEDADAIATRNDRRYGETRDDAAPGLGEDEHNAHRDDSRADTTAGPATRAEVGRAWPPRAKKRRGSRPRSRPRRPANPRLSRSAQARRRTASGSRSRSRWLVACRSTMRTPVKSFLVRYCRGSIEPRA